MSDLKSKKLLVIVESPNKCAHIKEYLKKAGYNVVGIYDKSEKNTDELKQLADVYIHNYSELDI